MKNFVFKLHLLILASFSFLFLGTGACEEGEGALDKEKYFRIKVSIGNNLERITYTLIPHGYCEATDEAVKGLRALTVKDKRGRRIRIVPVAEPSPHIDIVTDMPFVFTCDKCEEKGFQDGALVRESVSLKLKLTNEESP